MQKNFLYLKGTTKRWDILSYFRENDVLMSGFIENHIKVEIYDSVWSHASLE